jgi:hypothetical protein
MRGKGNGQVGAEFTAMEKCISGAQVLLAAVLNYERMLADRAAALRDR